MNVPACRATAAASNRGLKEKDVPNRRILLFPFVFLNTFGQCVLAISSKTGYNLNGMFSMGETCDLRKEDFHERID